MTVKSLNILQFFNYLQRLSVPLRKTFILRKQKKEKITKSIRYRFYCTHTTGGVEKSSTGEPAGKNEYVGPRHPPPRANLRNRKLDNGAAPA